jgi:hypothetical protein
MEIVELVIDSLSDPLIGGTTVVVLGTLLIIRKIKSKKPQRFTLDNSMDEVTLSGKEFELSRVIDDTTNNGGYSQTITPNTFSEDPTNNFSSISNQPKSIWDNKENFHQQTSSLASTMIVNNATNKENIKHSTESKNFINSAIHADYLDDPENALIHLNEAFEIENNPKEKLRIKIIISDYKKTISEDNFVSGSLIKVVEKLPTFIKDSSVQDVEPLADVENIEELKVKELTVKELKVNEKNSKENNNKDKDIIQQLSTPSLSSLLTRSTNDVSFNHTVLDIEQLSTPSQEIPSHLLKEKSKHYETNFDELIELTTQDEPITNKQSSQAPNNNSFNVVDDSWIDLPSDDIPVLEVIIEKSSVNHVVQPEVSTASSSTAQEDFPWLQQINSNFDDNIHLNTKDTIIIEDIVFSEQSSQESVSELEQFSVESSSAQEDFPWLQEIHSDNNIDLNTEDTIAVEDTNFSKQSSQEPASNLDQFLIDLRDEAEAQDRGLETDNNQVDGLLAQFNISPIEEDHSLQLEDLKPLKILPKTEKSIDLSTHSTTNMHVLAQTMTEIYDDINPTHATFPVWVNWMLEVSDKQQMKRSVIDLHQKWGTKNALEELTQYLNKEADKDSNGKEHTWAVLSVFPVEE